MLKLERILLNFSLHVLFIIKISLAGNIKGNFQLKKMSSIILLLNVCL